MNENNHSQKSNRLTLLAVFGALAVIGSVLVLSSSSVSAVDGAWCSTNADCGLYELCAGGSCTDISAMMTHREPHTGASTVDIPSELYQNFLQNAGYVKVECPDGSLGIEAPGAHPLMDPCYV